MHNTLYLTEDGSHTLYSPHFDQHYHSTHGAVQESMHIFIKSGLQHYLEKHQAPSVRIFEVGFGTGLNALLSQLYFQQINIDYTSVELYPITEDCYSNLRFNLPLAHAEEALLALHRAPWNTGVRLSPTFQLHKLQQDLRLYTPQAIDVVYFDAFSPEAQPELWDEPIFERLYKAITPGGILVTYCAKGEVRRCLQHVGFEVERIAGPIGKRHILRATKH